MTRGIDGIPAYLCVIGCLVLWLTPSDAIMRQCSARKAVTYNTELLDHAIGKPFPNNRLERRHAIIQELNRVDADVVCLQEVWIGEDVEVITKGVSGSYPHSTSKLHVGGRLPCQTDFIEPPCRFMDLNNFLWCVATHKCIGRNRSPIQVKECMNSACFPEIMRLSQECISCFVVSLSSPGEAFMKCAGNGVPVPGMRNMNEPGLIILSKAPIISSKYFDFHPYTKELIQRGYIEAAVEEFGTVVCTHLTMNLPQYFEGHLERIGAFRSYLEQGDSERQELISKYHSISPLLLMGDFNVGDAFSPFVVPSSPGKYCDLANVFKIKPLDVCTLCGRADNPYNDNPVSIFNTVVDHIFYKGHDVKDVKRIFTPHDRVLWSSGLPLSNHFGVLAIVDTCSSPYTLG